MEVTILKLMIVIIGIRNYEGTGVIFEEVACINEPYFKYNMNALRVVNYNTQDTIGYIEERRSENMTRIVVKSDTLANTRVVETL